jgi:tRNA(Ile)-lysidine synthase
MARLGPWDAARRVAVAVSGGADSLALAILAQGWGDPVAWIVDHGLRPGSAAEAEATRATLAARRMPARVLRLHGLTPGPGVAARARAARYAAMTAACREAGLVDLLVGHHAGDQAETVLMRQRRGSGPIGLAGMAALVETDDIRLLRPLLGYAPGRLRAVVDGAGLVPVEDPTNHDPHFTRARLRREIGEDRAALLATAAENGATRTVAEARIAAEMAARVSLHPEGFAVLSPGPVGGNTLAAVLRSVSGRRWPVSGGGELARAPRAATLAGVRIMPAGRLGQGWLLVREAAAMSPPVAAHRGAVWDGRFRVLSDVTGAVIGGSGPDAARPRGGKALPRAVLDSMPTFRCDPTLSEVLHLNYHALHAGRVSAACLPAAGAPFLA